MTLTAAIRALDEELERIGSERAKDAWRVLRRPLRDIAELVRQERRAEDETREVPR